MPSAHKLIVCGEDSSSEVEGWSRRRSERGMHRVLQGSALRVALQQAPWNAVLLVGLVAVNQLLPYLGSWTPAPWPWSLLTLAWALVMASLPEAWLRERRPYQVMVGVAISVLLAAAPAAWALSEQELLMWLVPNGVYSMALAASVAAHWPAALLLAAAPLLIGLTGGLPGLLCGSMLALLVLGAAWRMRSAWATNMVRMLAQSEQLHQIGRKRDAALRRDQDKSRFLAIASHDLRQPVHALGLFAATLHKRLQGSADEALSRSLLRSIEGLERSFNALLDLSRLDGGAIPVRAKVFPVRDIFRRLHMQFGGQAELAGLGLRMRPGGKSVVSDPQLLERILSNLIQNALRYTTQGGVAVVARNTHSHLNLEVWDTGCGIAADELPQIFDEFYQVGRSERDRSQGLGMGLAIVKRLTLLLGHRLEVASTPGRGTLFRVGVPLGTLDGISEETCATDTLPMDSDDGDARIVLVIDDEETIREGLVMLLQEWGYQVIAAANGEEAERAVATMGGHVDLLLSDLHLGARAGGHEVVGALRRLCGRHIPAILITGDTAGQQLREVTAGADPVLFKPVQARLLSAALRMALANKER
jgi:two-component system, sensor histidine kinase